MVGAEGGVARNVEKKGLTRRPVGNILNKRTSSKPSFNSTPSSRPTSAPHAEPSSSMPSTLPTSLPTSKPSFTSAPSSRQPSFTSAPSSRPTLEPQTEPSSSPSASPRLVFRQGLFLVQRRRLQLSPLRRFGARLQAPVV
jgi:hypothetical protein